MLYDVRMETSTGVVVAEWYALTEDEVDALYTRVHSCTNKAVLVTNMTVVDPE